MTAARSLVDDAESREVLRLRDFWSKRYHHCTLSESGWLGAGETHNAYVYRCKAQALVRALRDCGIQSTTRFSVLDAGCGQGFFADLYKQQYPACRYTGVDLVTTPLAGLRVRHPHYQFDAADISSWRPADGATFDVVQSFEVLHLFLDEGLVERTLRNLADRLTPTGVMLVTAALPDHTLTPSPYVRHLARTTFLHLTERADLRLVRERAMYFWLPDGGPSNRLLRFAFDLAGAGVLYAADRVALTLGLPRILQRGCDSAMKLLTLRK